jgi:hypothetical protein
VAYGGCNLCLVLATIILSCASDRLPAKKPWCQKERLLRLMPSLGQPSPAGVTERLAATHTTIAEPTRALRDNQRNPPGYVDPVIVLRHTSWRTVATRGVSCPQTGDVRACAGPLCGAFKP